MRHTILALIVISSLYAQGQAPSIISQNTLGGNLFERFRFIDKTSDGGCIVAGNSTSGISWDKTETNKGSNDYWIIKLNPDLSIQWQNSIGGSGDDQVSYIKELADGGYIVGGYSTSENYDKTEASLGSYDYWVFKLTSSGTIVWQNTIGGAGADYLRSVCETSDGGYVLAGSSSSSISGDKSENNLGLSDYWVLKINATGTILWQNTIGGTLEDELKSVYPCVDGGYILAGNSKSNASADKSENSIGVYDYWIVKLNSFGNIEWENTIGGSLDDILNVALPTDDGGFILGGYSVSGISGDKTVAGYGWNDFWLIKLDGSGTIEWQNGYGGSGGDELYSVLQTFDGGFIMSGSTASGISGIKTSENKGIVDYWIVKTNNTGDLEWQYGYGGSASDNSCKIVEKSAGNYFAAGISRSNVSFDKTDLCHGQDDYWVIDLVDCFIEVCNNNDDDCDGLIDDLDPDIIGQSLWYYDGDEDGYGNPLDSVFTCYAPVAYINNPDDCNDSDPIINPLAMELLNGIDDNCDGSIDVLEVVYFQTDYIEFSVNTTGAIGTDNPPPLGFHSNYGYSEPYSLGLVVDSDMDGWDIGSPLCCGDYVMPGTVVEGWAVEIGDSVWHNLGVSPTYFDIPGSNVFFERTFDKTTSIWEGNISSYNLHISQETQLIDTNLFFINTITFKNNGITALNDIYYLHLIDPDPEQVYADEFTTYNQVISNPPSDTDAIAISEGLEFGCYIGIAARNLNARATYGDYGMYDYIPSDAWNGLGLFELSGADESDENISIVFHIDELIAGDSIQFAFAYVFSPDEMEEALDLTDLSCIPSLELCNAIDDDCNGLIDDGVAETISIYAATPTTFCKGNNVVLTAVYTGASLQWQKNGIDIPGATSANYTATKTGSYTCITTGLCGIATSSEIIVTVYNNPPALITADGVTTFCMGESVTLSANIGPGLSYQWYKGASAIAGATSINYTASLPGNYRCRVIKTATGCYKNSNVISVTIPCRDEEMFGDEQDLENPAFTVYPNPATDRLTITLNTATNIVPSNYAIISDITGKIVASFAITSNVTYIDISIWASGVYFIQINTMDGYFRQKFVKAE